MAKKYSEQALRQAKDAARKAVTKQQADLGVPVPGGRAVDEFVDPIIAKMEREGEREKAPAPAPERDPEVTEEHVGSYDWDLRKDTITPHDGAWTPGRTDRLHMIMQKLLQLPDWKIKVLAARDLCKHHQMGGPFKGCANCSMRERRLEEILFDAFQKYGNPMKRKDKRIVVGAR